MVRAPPVTEEMCVRVAPKRALCGYWCREDFVPFVYGRTRHRAFIPEMAGSTPAGDTSVSVGQRNRRVGSGKVEHREP